VLIKTEGILSGKHGANRHFVRFHDNEDKLRAQVFGPFFQGKRNIDRAEGGLGSAGPEPHHAGQAGQSRAGGAPGGVRPAAPRRTPRLK
jgi:hypothetical protein